MTAIAGGTIAISPNASSAYTYLVQQGLSPAQAAGVVGNLMAESGNGVSPNAVNPTGPHTGIAQWSTTRWARLVAWAQGQGLPTNSLPTQLGYLWNELTTTYSGSLTALQATTTPAAAATTFQDDFEICGNSAMCGTPGRIANANAVYLAMTGKNPPPGSGAVAGATGSGSNPTTTCQVPINWPSVGPLGGGTTCLWEAGWSRALLGGLLLVAAGTMGIIAMSLILVESKTVQRVAAPVAKVAVFKRFMSP